MPSKEPPNKAIAELREKFPEPYEREKLKPWHYRMIAMKEFYGMTWNEVGEEFDRSGAHLCKIGNSPAGKEFRKKIGEMAPEEIAKVTLRAAAVDAAADFAWALELAKEHGNADLVYRMTKDMLKFADVSQAEGRKDSGGGGQTINIHLDASSLDIPEVSTSYEELTAEVVDED